MKNTRNIGEGLSKIEIAAIKIAPLVELMDEFYESFANQVHMSANNHRLFDRVSLYADMLSEIDKEIMEGINEYYQGRKKA